MDQTNSLIHPKTGFNPLTKTFHSLRLPIDLPPADAPISAPDYALSLHSNSVGLDSTALINSSTGHRISYSEFVRLTESLASYFQNITKLSKNDTAFILCPNSITIPILYFSLLSLGVVVSPANPVSTESEISRLIDLSKSVIAFATTSTAHKLPKLKHDTILIDSPEFDSIMKTSTTSTYKLRKVRVSQSDLAGILYSSGTTGGVKGVMLTHRNLTAVVAGSFKEERGAVQVVALNPVPYFHAYGFFYSVKSVALREMVVVMEKFDFKNMLRAIEEFRVTQLGVAPPVVLEMVKSDLSDNFNLSSLERVSCGGAPLGKDVIAAFTAKFPAACLWQGYGLTETLGVCSRPMSPEEALHWGSVGRLVAGIQAKIVHTETGDALLPGQQGELWVRGPSMMKGYIDDPEATSAALVSDGWLKTGDLCYIDEEGFVFVVDRLKELIKYKGYQVAPAELEQLLQSHPQIVDAAVLPYPDEVAGQVPLAFVVKQPQSSINERDIIDFVAKLVAPYKKIRRVAFISSIPKSPAGKILRKDLKKMISLVHASKM